MNGKVLKLFYYYLALNRARKNDTKLEKTENDRRVG